MSCDDLALMIDDVMKWDVGLMMPDARYVYSARSF